MKTFTSLFLGLAAAWFLSQPAVARADSISYTGSSYAAIAYSEKTGKYGYSFQQPARSTAETVALRNCKADDAKIVTWARNGFCALAVGDGTAWGIGYSYGDGATNTSAKERALAECQTRGKNSRLLLCVCALSNKVEVFDKE